MADFSKVKPSTNFEDRTGDTPHQKGMRAVAALLNPMTAVRNVRGKLIEKGVIEPAQSPFRRGMSKAGGK